MTEHDQQPKVMLRSRSALSYVVLALLSWGVLIPFWMVSLVRALKRLGCRDRTPWLWCFFVIPFVALACTSRLLCSFRAIACEDLRNHKRQIKGIGRYSVVGACLALFFEVYDWYDRGDLISTIFLMLVIVTSIAFTAAAVAGAWTVLVKICEQRKLNVVVNEAHSSWWETVIASMGGLCWAAYVASIMVLVPSHSKSLVPDQLVVVLKEPVVFRFQYESGYIATGPHQKDDHVMLVSGPNLWSTLQVFTYKQATQTVGGLTESRIADFDAEHDNAHCSQNMILDTKTYAQISDIRCTYSDFFSKSVVRSKIIEVPGSGIYELRGTLHHDFNDRRVAHDRKAFDRTFFSFDVSHGQIPQSQLVGVFHE